MKAGGIFLWAKLRLPKIVKRLNDGACEVKYLRTLIDTGSNELFAIYQSILETGIDCGVREKALLFMQWVCLAERPLSLEELRLAMACDGLTEDGLTECEDVSSFVRSDERMERLVRSLSGGLAVVVSSSQSGGRSGGQRSTRIVQLFHAIVYDFLRG